MLVQLQSSSQALCGMQWAYTGSVWRAQRQMWIMALPAQHARRPPGLSSSAGLPSLRWLRLPHPLLRGWEAPVEGRRGNIQALKVCRTCILPDALDASGVFAHHSRHLCFKLGTCACIILGKAVIYHTQAKQETSTQQRGERLILSSPHHLLRSWRCCQDQRALCSH